MNGEGGIGRAEEDLGYLRGSLVTGFEVGSAFPGGWYPDISVGPFFPQFAAYAQLPALRVLPTTVQTDDSVAEVDGNGEVQAVEVIEPGYEATTTVFEGAPGGIYETNRAPTDWGRVYEEYVVLNAPEVAQAPQEVEEVIDWGKVAGTIVGGYLDPFGAGQATTDFFGMAGPAGVIPGPVSRAGPAGRVPAVKIDPRTGKVICRRRRRRRLLTDGDFNDLMRISTLPNKDIVKIALAKAVGR